MSEEKRIGRPPRTEDEPTSFLDSPEFKAAVAGAVEKALKGVADTAGEVGEKAAGMEWARSMAMAIAEVADQGTNRKRVAPEILAAREAAHGRLRALLVEVKAKNLWPEYRCISKLYLNERLIDPYIQQDHKAVPVDFKWQGEPNHAMKPLNDIARTIFAEFEASRGSAPTTGKEDNRAYWLTPAGLVVKGDPPQHRVMGAGHGPEFQDGLEILNQTDPNAPFVHILGTIAPPAMQNFEGKAP